MSLHLPNEIPEAPPAPPLPIQVRRRIPTLPILNIPVSNELQEIISHSNLNSDRNEGESN